MKRRIIALALLAACRQPAPADHYGFVARLGADTVSLESVSRAGNTITSDEVDRFPRVRQRHTEITLGDDGGIQHLVMDVTTPSEPENERRRYIVADVTHDSVLMTKRDGQSYQRWSFGRGGATIVAHVPQMYSLYELYFSAALGRHKPSTSDDTVPLRQIYIDREFDRFPLGHVSVERLSGGKSKVWHDWLSGVGDATVDSVGRLLHYSGAHTTYQVDVERLSDPPNVLPVGVQFIAREAKEGGVKQLSVRDTTRATIGAAAFAVDYGRPLVRGRQLLGGVIPYGDVWRTGANAATQFTTSAPITLAGIKLAAGTYTLWTLPQAGSTQLIVNAQTKQWGTEYDRAHDIARAALTSEPARTSVEEFTISIVPTNAQRGTLAMEWGPFRWTAPIVVQR